MGGEEKAVSSNPGTRGAAQQDASRSTKHRHQGGEGERCTTPQRGCGDSSWTGAVCAVLTLATSSFHEGAPPPVSVVIPFSRSLFEGRCGCRDEMRCCHILSWSFVHYIDLRNSSASRDALGFIRRDFFMEEVDLFVYVGAVKIRRVSVLWHGANHVPLQHHYLPADPPALPPLFGRQPSPRCVGRGATPHRRAPLLPLVWSRAHCGHLRYTFMSGTNTRCDYASPAILYDFLKFI